MNARPVLFIFLFSVFSVLMTEVNGQVKVLAHITAEVVESAHASSEIINGIELRSEKISTSIHQNKSFESELLNVGAVKINAGEDIACCIDLHKTILSDNSGNFFTIEPASVNSGLSYSSGGSQTLLLNGVARVTDYSARGFYTGHLTVVVQYN
jgi:hypothetical protein